MMDAATDPAIETVVICTSSQIGKALALDTPLPTPSGWALMRDVNPGDTLFDESGKPCRVVAVSPVQNDRPCYRVAFGDGSVLTADAEHRWRVEPSNGLGQKYGAGVYTTEELRAALHARGTGGRLRNVWAVPVAGPLQLPDAELPIPPYVLGQWLGNGHAYSATIHTGEKDFLETKRIIEAEGVEVKAKKHRTAWAMTLDPLQHDGSYCRGYATQAEYNAAKYNHKRHGAPFNPIAERRPTMQAKLNDLGLLKNKHIPSAYLRASEPQRQALLQGLMDTDGHASKHGVCEFTSVNAHLASGVLELAISLGLKPTLKQGRATLNGRDMGAKYRVVFVAYSHHQVFRLERKQGRLRDIADPRVRPSETMRRFIASIDRVESVPVKCVAVDSESHLYLAGRSMIPTHNTEVVGNVIGYFMSQDPSPILVVQPTVEMAEAWSKDRLTPMVDETEILRGLVQPARSRDSGNTITHKQFPGGHVTVVGANAPAGLASRPIRIVLCDEVDRFPASAGTEGDPVTLARRRADTFWNRKVVLTSTPTVKGVSRIEKAWEASDQRRYYVPCPECGEFQPLEWPRLQWTERESESALYFCRACGVGISEALKSGMLAAGEWRAENPGAGRVAGFHINALYSPWRRWHELVTEWYECQGDPVRLQVFVNTILGETWEEEGDTLEAGGLAARREAYATELPAGVGILTAAVDVQGDRLEAQIVGWGAGEEAWLVAFSQFPGDPGRQEVWHELDEFLQQRFTAPSGDQIGIAYTLIDSGGHHTDDVYRFCSARAPRRIYPCKGYAQAGKELVSRPSKNNRYHVRLHMIGTDTGKDMVFSRLRVSSPGPGYLHLPDWIDEEWITQLTAEKKISRYVKGRGTRREYVKLRPRNEALDLTVYALAALHSLGSPTLRGLAGRAAELARTPDATQGEGKQQAKPTAGPAKWDPFRGQGGGGSWVNNW